MKILFLTHLKDDAQAVNDIINDSLLHGLRENHGVDVVDFPGAWYMYKDEINKRSFDISKLWGSGFTYYDNLTNYNSVDRTDIKQKIENNFFDYIIYGSFTRSNIFFEQSLKSKSKIILIDGEDNTNLHFNKNEKIIFFKRELIQTKPNVFPINVTIPKRKITNEINLNPKNILAPLIPHRYKTYIYKKENDYYNMWKDSLFGVTYVHGGWWEAVRYYEMLMNGCIPLILDLKKCPDKTLTKLPKEKLVKIFVDFSWILSQENPFRIYKKKFLNFERISSYLFHLFKKKYDSKKLLEEFPEVNDYRKDLLEHTKKYLTTEHIADYVIKTSEKFYSR